MEFDNVASTNIMFLDLPNELIMAIVAYLDSVSTREFAIVCNRAVEVILALYPDVCTVNEYNKYGIQFYMGILKQCSCGFCDKIMYMCGCKWTIDKPLGYRCSDCNRYDHIDMFKPILLKNSYDCRHKNILVCRFGCNWYCGYCDKVFKRSAGMEVEPDGWLVCGSCLYNRSLDKNRVTTFSLWRLGYGFDEQHKQLDDCKYKYPKTKEVIQRYQPQFAYSRRT